ncbi:MAG: hypothetical protein WC197_09410, partial [Candidatus Gastranaerophilaceae bacterium]
MTDNFLNLYLEKRSRGQKQLSEVVSVNPNSDTSTTSFDLPKKDVYEVIKTDDNLPKTPTLPITKIYSTIPSVEKEFVSLLIHSLPISRRISGINDTMESKDKLKALGLGIIATINAKEDIRDILSMFGKSKIHAPDGYSSKFGFFLTGATSVAEWFKKYEWGRFILDKLDMTIGDSIIGKTILKKLNVKSTINTFKKETQYLDVPSEVLLRKCVKLEGSKIGKLIGLALYKMPVLGLAAGAILEIPGILKSKHKLKQLVNSSLNVVCGASCAAILCASFLPISPILSLLGWGAGFYLGGKLVDAIGFKIND